MDKTTFEYQIHCYIPWDAVDIQSPLEFTVSPDIRVSFFRQKPKQDEPPECSPLYASASVARSMRAHNTLAKFLMALIEGRLALELFDERRLSELRAREPDAAASGLLPKGRSIPESLLPDFYANHLLDMRKTLGDAVEHVLDILAHRVGGLPDARGPTLRLVSIRVPPTTEWTRLPQCIVGGGSLGGPIEYVSPQAVADVQALLSKSESPPLTGYSLFREAWGAMFGHPRAAFITAFVAIETSCKEWLSHEVPETAWLLAKMPSPPLDLLVSHPVEQVVRRRGFSPEADELKRLAVELKKYTTIRNDLVHGRGSNLTYSETKAAIRDMERVYWLLQVVSATPGARENLNMAQDRR